MNPAAGAPVNPGSDGGPDPSPAPGRPTVFLALATANPHKAAEITTILAEAGPGGARIELLPRPASVAEVEETGTTLLENARLKAVAIAEATGTAAVADDTGLEVEALDGAPGVWSARYAGEHATYADNVAKLLAELAVLPAGGGARTARFRTVALVVFPGGGEIAAEGVVEGVIVAEPRGGDGFGYDPVFVPAEGDGRTFAEMSSEEKHAVSHRGRAFRMLAEALARDPNRPA